jgi:hypothetical protein
MSWYLFFFGFVRLSTARRANCTVDREAAYFAHPKKARDRRRTASETVGNRPPSSSSSLLPAPLVCLFFKVKMGASPSNPYYYCYSLLLLAACSSRLAALVLHQKNGDRFSFLPSLSRGHVLPPQITHRVLSL